MSKRPGDPGYAPGWCIYFRSMLHDTCEKDVNYDVLAGGRAGSLNRLPCFIKPGEDRSGRVSCEHFRPPTTEEVEAHEAWCDARMNDLSKVMKAILPWRTEHKTKRLGGAQTIDCPACGGIKTLSMTIAAYNGHIHGRCTTVGCVSWME